MAGTRTGKNYSDCRPAFGFCQCSSAAADSSRPALPRSTAVQKRLGYKIRQATLEKVPYMITIGDKEVENQTVSVRLRNGVDLGAMAPEALLARLVQEVATKQKTSDGAEQAK